MINMLMLPPGEYFANVLIDHNSEIASAEKHKLTGGRLRRRGAGGRLMNPSGEKRSK
jgi:hypothetical protein